MRAIPVLILTLLPLASWGAFAGDLPVISLPEGTSAVALSVLNSGETDLSGVAVTVERSSLPSWLAVQETMQAVDAPKGTKAPERLSLTFRMTGAPRNAETAVPFTLKDNMGNAWSYTLTVRASAKLPARNTLFENSPNPFNPTTTLRFALMETGPVTLAVYNSLGQKVRILVDGPRNAGEHAVMWDGRDDAGRSVSSGVYFARMQAGKFVKTQKMLYAR